MFAGPIYKAAGRDAQALAANARRIALQPDADAYLERVRWGGAAAPDAVLKDLAKSLAQKPGDNAALAQTAYLQTESGDWRGAAATFAPEVAAHPDDTRLRGTYAIFLARSGDLTNGARELAEARRRGAADARLLNQLCWDAATANLWLDAALADCRAAVALDASPHNFDSLGFVLLRLRRDREAVAAMTMP